MFTRLALSIIVASLLAACGACEANVNNSGTRNGRCSVFSMPL